MLKNYLKIALRTIQRQKGYAFINVVGLAAGLACCLLILFYVQDELRYDRFHADADRIYRAVLDLTSPASTRALATTPAALAPAVREEFPEVEQSVRLFKPSSTVVAYEDRTAQEGAFIFADSSFFEVFSFPLRQGDAEVLRAPYSVVLSETTARRYFGDADPVGEVLTVNDTLAFRITGVAQDAPAQSHLHFDFVASMGSWEAMVPSLVNTWAPHMYYTYLRLAPNAAPAALEARLPSLVERSVDLSEGWRFDFHLQALPDLHFFSNRESEMEARVRIEQVYAFGAIAVFILLLACINFMNLATARAARRLREVGMRKVLGAHRRQLIGQFLSEALLMSAVAVVLSVVLVVLSLPLFNALADKSLTLAVLGQPMLWVLLPSLALTVGLLAGSYPAFFLSAHRPLAVLKGAVPGQRSSAILLRKGLVVFQFAVSIILITGTGIVYNQLRFMRSQDLGFAPEQIVVLSSLDGQRYDQATAFVQEVQNLASVRGATLSNIVPGRGALGLSIQGEGMSADEWQVMNTLFVDANFAETYQMEVVAGRDFSPEFTTDSTTAFMLNEAAVRELGWTPEEAVGKRFALRRGGGQVVGVVRDFHYVSLAESIEPLALVGTPVAFGSAPLYVSLRLGTDDLASTLRLLESRWQALVPARPFTYFFLDDDFGRLYQADERLGRISGVFALLAVLIACLGLFGLAAFTAERRTKEVGVRKVLGASVAGLVALLSKDFLVLVGVAFVVAVPVAYLAMERWLDGFAYRVDLGPGVFALAGVLALLIAGLTVSYQAIRLALADPVKSLRHE